MSFSCAGAALAQTNDARLIRQEVKDQVIFRRQFGWERPLTQKEPNLSHWHWEPISNSYRHVQSKNIYTKITHPLALKSDNSLVQKETTNSSSTSAKLRSKSYSCETASELLNQKSAQKNAPVVFSYDSTYHSQPSSYQMDRANANHSRTTVAGKLLRNRNADFE